MNWLEKITQRLDVVTTEDDRFRTGQPIDFHYMRNTESSPDFGERFQQHIEPDPAYLCSDKFLSAVKIQPES